MLLVSTSDSVIGRVLFQFGEFDFDKFIQALDVMRDHGLKVPTTLVDIGANIGSICIPAVARKLVDTAIAIEPGVENCRLLRANIELNDLRGKIHVHEVALGAKDGERLTLELSQDNAGDHRIAVDGHHSGRSGVEVLSARLDTVLQDHGSESIFLWMDVQGYEGHVLAGAPLTLGKRPPLVLEFWPRGLRRTASFDILRECLAGYDCFVDLNEPRRVRPISELDGLYQEIGQGNDPPRMTDFTDILVFSAAASGSQSASGIAAPSHG